MYIIKFVTRKDADASFPTYSFGDVLKFGLSYKAGIGLFWVVIHKDGRKTYLNHKFYTIGQIVDLEGANNEEY